jgi:hypothetical protein
VAEKAFFEDLGAARWTGPPAYPLAAMGAFHVSRLLGYVRNGYSRDFYHIRADSSTLLKTRGRPVEESWRDHLSVHP